MLSGVSCSAIIYGGRLMIYQVYVEYKGEMFLASQHNCPSLCLDKYKRLRKQGHKKIEIRFNDTVIQQAVNLKIVKT